MKSGNIGPQRGRQQPGITNTLGQDNPLSSKFGNKCYFRALAEQPRNTVVLFSWSSHLPLFQILYGYVIHQASVLDTSWVDYGQFHITGTGDPLTQFSLPRIPLL